MSSLYEGLATWKSLSRQKKHEMWHSNQIIKPIKVLKGRTLQGRINYFKLIVFYKIILGHRALKSNENRSGEGLRLN